MMQQNVDRILELAFELMDQSEPEVRLHQVALLLVPPRTVLPSLLDTPVHGE